MTKDMVKFREQLLAYADLVKSEIEGINDIAGDACQVPVTAEDFLVTINEHFQVRKKVKNFALFVIWKVTKNE